MIRSIHYDKQGRSRRDLSLQEMALALKDKDGLLWVSLEHAGPQEIQDVLGGVFNFHPLSIEDVLSAGYQTPKVDDFGNYLLIVAHAPQPDNELATLDTNELNIFLGKNFLLSSYLSEQMHPVEEVWRRIERDERLVNFGADFLCHALLDVLVDDYMPMLDEMDEEIDSLEDTVLIKPNPLTLERILTLKHAILSLRRVITPQREVMNRLSRDEFTMIDRHSRIYFRDIYDHLVRIQDLSETIRDVVGGTLDTYLSATSNRLNEVMKALTVVSTIFLPLSFIAGVYGMNFRYVVPDYDWRYGFVLFWMLCISVAGGMLLFFKKRGWF